MICDVCGGLMFLVIIGYYCSGDVCYIVVDFVWVVCVFGFCVVVDLGEGLCEFVFVLFC